MSKLLNAIKIACFSTAVIVSTSASAADFIGELNGVSGEVLIERNGELLLGTDQSALIPNDKIFVGEGAAGNISLSEGCQSTLTESTSVLIGSENFCSNITKYAQAEPTPTPATNADKSPVLKKAPNAIDWARIAPVAGAVAAVATIVIIADDGGNDSPSSP